MSVEKELPDEQQPDGELSGDTAPQPYEQAKQIERQFDAIVSSTIDDTTATATVERIDTAPTGNTIVVGVDIAAEDGTKEFRFPKPKLASERYSFVRWLRYYDYSLGDFAGMVENRVEVEVKEESDGYELVYPEYDDATRRERAAATVADVQGELSEMGTFFSVWIGSLIASTLFMLAAFGWSALPSIALLGVMQLGVALGVTMLFRSFP